MAEMEWARLARRRTPVNELLGLVMNQLGTELGEAEWTHGWHGLGMARLEWAAGPSVATVVDLLLPACVDGELHGIPGLRLKEAEEGYADLRWLAAPPTRLYITRLPATSPEARAFARDVMAAINAAS